VRKCGLASRAEDSNRELGEDFDKKCISHYNEGSFDTSDFKYGGATSGYYGPNKEFYSPSKYEDRHASFYTRSIVSKFHEKGYFL
jgi:hypothetical protein